MLKQHAGGELPAEHGMAWHGMFRGFESYKDAQAPRDHRVLQDRQVTQSGIYETWHSHFGRLKAADYQSRVFESHKNARTDPTDNHGVLQAKAITASSLWKILPHPHTPSPPPHPSTHPAGTWLVSGGNSPSLSRRDIRVTSMEGRPARMPSSVSLTQEASS